MSKNIDWDRCMRNGMLFNELKDFMKLETMRHITSLIMFTTWFVYLVGTGLELVEETQKLLITIAIFLSMLSKFLVYILVKDLRSVLYERLVENHYCEEYIEKYEAFFNLLLLQIWTVISIVSIGKYIFIHNSTKLVFVQIFLLVLMIYLAKIILKNNVEMKEIEKKIKTKGVFKDEENG